MALEHYAQVTEADMQEAAKTSLLADAEEVAQNAAQYPVVQGGNEQKNTKDKDDENAVFPLNSAK